MSCARFTNSAEEDLLELWLTIAEENLVAADESLDSIKTTALLLATQPEMGRARPELADRLRSFPTRTPYCSGQVFSYTKIGCFAANCFS